VRRKEKKLLSGVSRIIGGSCPALFSNRGYSRVSPLLRYQIHVAHQVLAGEVTRAQYECFTKEALRQGTQSTNVVEAPVSNSKLRP
jgi:hypothetical protein